MGRWKTIARRIREQGADCLLRVRANHQGLHDRLQDTWNLERAGNFAGYVHDYADTVGKGHGRIEIRHCWTTGDPRDNYNITAAKLSYNHQLVSMA